MLFVLLVLFIRPHTADGTGSVIPKDKRSVTKRLNQNNLILRNGNVLEYIRCDDERRSTRSSMVTKP